jgi:hypothetical protein
MKKFITILFLLLNVISIAHEQHVHQYLSREAYLLLQSIYGDIPVMVDHVGTTQQGSGPWTSPYIVTGAYREDEEDVVYHEEGLFGVYSSGTHFWIADNGENSDVTLKWTIEGVYGQKTFPSAYTKIQRYAYGEWDIDITLGVAGIPLPNGGGCAQQNAVLHLSYNSLPDLFVNKNLYITKATFLDGDVYYNPPIRLVNEYLMFTTVEELVNKFTWEILGRMCHLIQDMSVPAHAKRDEHGLPPTDQYEDWVAGSSSDRYQYYNFSNIGTNFLDPYISSNPIHFLMYTTQQISDHFGSSGPYEGVGNDNLAGNYLPEEINYLNSLPYSQLGQPTYLSANFSYNELINIRDKTLPQAIKATAGLLYWFAIENGLICNITLKNSFNAGTILFDSQSNPSGAVKPVLRSKIKQQTISTKPMEPI